mmetsp:Transcript_11608/g.37120  ORF Transcript_11608/g.37120 Transcript_11608/m.37120 type:complete len:259 (-) Transcript_11608:960-1736(-)
MPNGPRRPKIAAVRKMAPVVLRYRGCTPISGHTPRSQKRRSLGERPPTESTADEWTMPDGPRTPDTENCALLRPERRSKHFHRVARAWAHSSKLHHNLATAATRAPLKPGQASEPRFCNSASTSRHALAPAWLAAPASSKPARHSEATSSMLLLGRSRGRDDAYRESGSSKTSTCCFLSSMRPSMRRLVARPELLAARSDFRAACRAPIWNLCRTAGDEPQRPPGRRHAHCHAPRKKCSRTSSAASCKCTTGSSRTEA